MTTATAGQTVSWLLNNKTGRAAMGTVLEVNPAAADTCLVVRVDSVESKRDAKRIGEKWSLPIRYAVAM